MIINRYRYLLHFLSYNRHRYRYRLGFALNNRHRYRYRLEPTFNNRYRLEFNNRSISIPGKYHLEEIIAIIKSRRVNAHRRAVGKNRSLVFSPSSPSLCPLGTTVRKTRRRHIRPKKKAGIKLQPLMDVFIPADIKSD